MIRKFGLGALAFALIACAAPVYAGSNLDPLIAKHAAAHKLPESLVRRVIKRESGGNPRVIYHGNYGLMQIRLGTARAMGYRGTADGLLDPDTNMTYAVKYLAGAYRVADGDADRAVHYYQAGYYYAAKRKAGRETPAAAHTESHAAARQEPRAQTSESDSPGLLARLVNALARHAETTGSNKHTSKPRKARAANVASSSSLYGGRPDSY
jgi:soluble lytic murein transglycosylase-like protein